MPGFWGVDRIVSFHFPRAENRTGLPHPDCSGIVGASLLRQISAGSYTVVRLDVLQPRADGESLHTHQNCHALSIIEASQPVLSLA
jgi:hypothetical protein